MKNIFFENKIPCAKGMEISYAEDYKGDFPVILKPRDNSGSRGVIYCKNKNELKSTFEEVKSYTRKNSILVEEFIEGKEYSIESLHINNQHNVVQITEKLTTKFPYNVELEHLQPSILPIFILDKIKKIINEIGDAFGFNNCASHTELKINNKDQLFIIETSPRLGGDFITSHLVPLSTGINMEDVLLDNAVGNAIYVSSSKENASLVHFFNMEGVVVTSRLLQKLSEIKNHPNVVEISVEFKKGEKLNKIKCSLDRYGYFILNSDNRIEIIKQKEKILDYLNDNQ